MKRLVCLFVEMGNPKCFRVTAPHVGWPREGKLLEKSVVCKNINSEDDLKKIMENYEANKNEDTKLKKLIITESSISQLILQNSPKLAQLTNLEVTFCNVKSIPENFFGTQNALVQLSLEYNGISELPSGIFSKLPLLEILNLGNNKFKTLSVGMFTPLKQLKRLDLHCNKIVKVDSAAFHGLSLLEELNLEENAIESLGEALQLLTNIKILKLQMNCIKILDETSFKNLTNLSKLNLSNNGLSTIHPQTFKDLKALTSLDLSDNTIEGLDEEIFCNNSCLKKLVLHSLALEAIPKLSNLINLETLLLNSNNLPIIKNQIFASLCNLRFLVLDFCEIKEIEENAFKDLKLLYSLSMCRNSIVKLPPSLLDGLTSLRILNLGFNQIHDINGEEFKNTKNLQSLCLSDNPLHSLTPDMFKHLQSLHVLSLGGINLKNVDPLTFFNLKNLKRLNMAWNDFSLINDHESVEWLDGLENLEILVLNSCDLEKLIKFSKHPLKSLKYLDVTFNELKSISKDFFDFCPSLMYMKVTRLFTKTEVILQWMRNYPNIIFDIKNC